MWCREFVSGQVSQSYPWRLRAARRPIHRPDGVIRRSICTQRLWEGNLAAAGVPLIALTSSVGVFSEDWASLRCWLARTQSSFQPRPALYICDPILTPSRNAHPHTLAIPTISHHPLGQSQTVPTDEAPFHCSMIAEMFLWQLLGDSVNSRGYMIIFQCFKAFWGCSDRSGPPPLAASLVMDVSL